MASLKDIRRRINSVKNTRQTTRAMKMVAAAKLRKSQDAIVNSRPYAKKIDEVVGKIAAAGEAESKYFQPANKEGKKLIVVATSDRGLCGGFNANLSKKALEFLKQNEGDFVLVCIGKKGADYLKNRGFEPSRVILNLVKEINFNYAQDLARSFIEEYFNDGYSELIFFFNEFESAISQVPTQQTVLPVQSKEELWEKQAQGFSKDYIYEPNKKEILDHLLEKSTITQIYKCLLESLASEHGARMNAMENATKNAGELIDKLTLTYNNLRQAAITTELIEITSGAEAL